MLFFAKPARTTLQQKLDADHLIENCKPEPCNLARATERAAAKECEYCCDGPCRCENSSIAVRYATIQVDLHIDWA